MATKAPDEIPEPWFKPKRIGYGLTPITWQGWFVTFLLMVVLSVSVYAVTDLIRDPLKCRHRSSYSHIDRGYRIYPVQLPACKIVR